MRQVAKKLAQEIARFPQECVRADRRSVYLQHGLRVREAMEREWWNGIAVLEQEGIVGASRFVSGTRWPEKAITPCEEGKNLLREFCGDK